tara:strand:- start:456 stop:1172 length:717 start_codon:yes stop_codon:yes gene_type:complete
MSVWRLIDRDLEILKHEDCLGILGYYESLLKDGIKTNESIPSEDRKRFYQVPAGSRVPHLVVRNNIEGTIDKSVVEGFDKLFQEGIKVVGALTNVDGDHKELKQKFEDREFKPGEERVEQTLMIECIFWYRARLLRQRQRETKHKDIFSTVNHELDTLKKDMQTFIDFTVQASMISFAEFLERAGYPKEAATAVKVNIITLHTLGGVVVDSEEDLEKMRSLEDRVEKKKKEYFDPSYM